MNQNGGFPDEEKMKAIKEMPTPRCKNDIQKILGLVNYIDFTNERIIEEKLKTLNGMRTSNIQLKALRTLLFRKNA